MTHFQPFVNYTAQSANVGALYSLLAVYKNNKGMDPLPVVVFLAFTIESYVNSIGSRKINCWDDIEKISWKLKIELLFSFAGCKADWGSATLGFAKEVFQLRDKLAHGKPVKVVGSRHSSSESAQNELLELQLGPKWKSKITSEWIERAWVRYRALIKELANLYGIHESDIQRVSDGGVNVFEY